MIFKSLFRLSIIKTIRFNFHYFGWKGLFYFPALIAKGVRLKSLKGRVILSSLSFKKIMVGFPNSSIPVTKGILDINGELHVSGKLFLAEGACLKIGKDGSLDIVDLTVTGNTCITCLKKISIGNGCLISWGAI